MVLHDWQRGKIPFFTPPPVRDPAEVARIAADKAASAPRIKVEQRFGSIPQLAKFDREDTRELRWCKDAGEGVELGVY